MVDKRKSAETLAAEAQEQYKADQEARLKDPNKPVIREAKFGVGGESFDYLNPESRAPSGGEVVEV